MQVAVIEYARNVCGLPRAHSTEFDLKTPDPVIGLITEWQDEAGRKQQRDAGSDKGGTMRLGSQACRLKAGSKSRALYNAEIIRERHRHRSEFNNKYKQILSDHRLDLVAESAENELAEMVELPNHPFFVGRSEEHTSELQSLMRTSYAVFCLKQKKKDHIHIQNL